MWNQVQSDLPHQQLQSPLHDQELLNMHSSRRLLDYPNLFRLTLNCMEANLD